MRSVVALAPALLAGLIVAAGLDAAEVKTRGKLEVGPNIPILAVSTDPVVQRVLTEDFYAANRGPSTVAKNSTTLTVMLSQRVLKPGVSLNDLAPGDPAVVALIRAAGATPPTVGDSGNKPPNLYEETARMEALRPDDPAVTQFMAQQAFQRNAGMPGAGPPRIAQAEDEQTYDTVIVARVTADDRAGGFTAVAVAHPGDDIRAVKKLIAEEIASAALH
ncbi:MAG: hypothetical protein WA005_14465 [Candidatus Binataceae bacterium]